MGISSGCSGLNPVSSPRMETGQSVSLASQPVHRSPWPGWGQVPHTGSGMSESPRHKHPQRRQPREDTQRSTVMLAEAGHSLAACLHLSSGAGRPMIPPNEVQGALPFPLPQSPSPRGLSQAAGGQRHLVLLQDGCSSSQLDLSPKGALRSFSSSLPCCDSWLHSLPFLIWELCISSLFLHWENQCQRVPFYMLCHQPRLLPWSPARGRSQTHHAP